MYGEEKENGREEEGMRETGERGCWLGRSKEREKKEEEKKRRRGVSGVLRGTGGGALLEREEGKEKEEGEGCSGEKERKEKRREKEKR